MKSRWLLWLIIIVLGFSVFIDTPKNFIPILPKQLNFANSFLHLEIPLKLGLDLQGGTELTLQTDMSKINPSSYDNALQSAKDVIERRVNLFGVSESVVQTSTVGSERRILLELPGLKDASAAANLVGKTAQLDFREIPASRSAEATQSAYAVYFYSVTTGLTGADLKSAQVSFAGSSKGVQSGPQVGIDFTDQGAKKFAEITKRNIGKPLAIFLDNEMIEAPTVQSEIDNGSAVITGKFTVETAKGLANLLNAGALPVPIKILEQRTIGPSLGQQSINKSVMAGAVGVLVVMVYMAAFYGLYGLLADLALIIYALMVLTIFKTGLFILPPVTLSLAGIAGFILSIGMAVDANILIFERMKEELRWGKSKGRALELGFDRAWTSIWASNVSSLMTASILYFFGTSFVRGFAVTLAIGVLVSMFTAIVVTRTFLRIFVR